MKRGPLPLSKRKPAATQLKAISDQHWRFIARFCIHLDQSRAYREVYGPDVKNTEVAASRLMGQKLIRAEIDKRIKQIMERYTDSPTRTVEELTRIAYGNPQDLHDENGKLLKTQDIPRHVFGTVREIKYGDTGSVVEIKTHDKLSALKLLGTYEGIFTERVEVVSGEEMVRLIREGRERALRRGQQQ